MIWAMVHFAKHTRDCHMMQGDADLLKDYSGDNVAETWLFLLKSFVDTEKTRSVLMSNMSAVRLVRNVFLPKYDACPKVTVRVGVTVLTLHTSAAGEQREFFRHVQERASSLEPPLW